MNKTVNLKIWGRVFDLDVVYDAYAGEEVLPEQIKALDALLEEMKNYQIAIGEKKEYNKNSAGSVLSDPQNAIDFCKKDAGNRIEGEITNIFKYIVPNSFFVTRNDKTREVALLCDYRFDEEHGIAIIFENEVLKEIGSQDLL